MKQDKSDSSKEEEVSSKSPVAGIVEKFRLLPLLYCLIAFLFTAGIASLATQTSFMLYLRLFMGVFFYTVVPGYMLLLNVEIDDLERLVLATAVGITVIPLCLFNLNLFLVKTTPLLIWSLIGIISLIGVVIKWKSR